jgi:periplasmic protein TonB
MQASLAISLALVIGLFAIPLRSGGDSFENVSVTFETVTLEEVEPTRQVLPPPSLAPPPPVAVPDDAEVEDVILDLDMDLDLSRVAVVPPPPPPPPAAAPPPPPPPDEPEIFVIVEQPPVLIGGLEGVQSRVRYPEVARMAGIEGVVYLQFVIDEAGRVSDIVCLRDPGGGTCEAATAAARDATFEPGRQRGRAVKVRYAMPIRFRLRD